MTSHSLQCRWVLGLMDKGQAAGDNGDDDREPAITSLLHNVVQFGLEASTTTHLQDTFSSGTKCCGWKRSPSSLSLPWKGQQLQSTPLSLLCDLMDGMSQVAHIA